MKPRLVYQRHDGLSRDPIFIARVMARWDLGQDTARIAAELMTAEAFVANALAFERDRRAGMGP